MDWDLLLGLGRFVLATTLLLLLTVPTAFIIIQIELKVIASMNLRLGPNRLGPSGMFQSTIHGFKVLAKEDTVPDQADRGTFTLAPWMVYMAAAMSMLVIPFAPGAIADFNIGIVTSSGARATWSGAVAGWASQQVLDAGGCAAPQIVSYEIPLTLSIVGDGVRRHAHSAADRLAARAWLLLIAAGGLASSSSIAGRGNRTPFDMGEADAEMVAGPSRYSACAWLLLLRASWRSSSCAASNSLASAAGCAGPFPAADGFGGTLYGTLMVLLKDYSWFVASGASTLPRCGRQMMGVAEGHTRWNS